jgi:hypothetical protein
VVALTPESTANANAGGIGDADGLVPNVAVRDGEPVAVINSDCVGVPLFVDVIDELVLPVAVAEHEGAIESPVIKQPTKHGHTMAAPEPMGQ